MGMLPDTCGWQMLTFVNTASLLRMHHTQLNSTNDPDPWPNADIDLFVYGLNPKDANKKVWKSLFEFNVYRNIQVLTIYSTIIKRIPVVCVRTTCTLCFESSQYKRAIQIVLRYFSTLLFSVYFFPPILDAFLYYFHELNLFICTFFLICQNRIFDNKEDIIQQFDVDCCAGTQFGE